MSTNSTVYYGEGFHLYEDLADAEAIYLSLDDAKVKVHTIGGKPYAIIRIPLPIWEVIKRYKPDFRSAAMSDAEIKDSVTRAVEDRISRHEGGDNLASFFGAAIYGPATASKAKQVALGVAYYKKERARQRRILDEADRLAKRPKTSWETKVGSKPSPLAKIAAKDPPIVVTEKARKEAEKRLAKALKPYQNAKQAAEEARRGVLRKRDTRAGKKRY